MPAREKEHLNTSIKKLAIIAGGGRIPQQLKDQCLALGIEPFVVGLKGNTDEITPDYLSPIGRAGKIISRLRQENITDIVMIGAVKRPTIWDCYCDLTTLKFVFKCWVKSFGDNGMLEATKSELENMGFKLHGVHQFLPELLMPEGILGAHPPLAGHQMDVQVGIKAARELGAQDIGQAVLVKDNKVIAREDARGTSAMIKRYGTGGAILVKMCKPQQDKDLDLPTIGPKTVELCVLKGMAGIVGQAGNMLMVERDEVRELANKNEIFVLGVSVDEPR